MITLLERLQPKRIESIADTVESLIPEGTGQMPSILLHQTRARLTGWDVTLVDMQLAFDYLEKEGRVFPPQNLDRTVFSRVYAPRVKVRPLRRCY